jgi:hypothetical protein
VTTVTLYQSTSLCREENQLNGAPPGTVTVLMASLMGRTFGRTARAL